MVYHLFARGDNKAHLFRDDDDFAHFLTVLRAGLTRFGIECLAYCLLSNHYHLLVKPYQHSVSRLMQQVNGTYCQWFNRRHGRVGHVLQGRFGSRIIDHHEYLLNAVKYVAMNPVAAGCVANPGDWAWSSYRATAGLCDIPELLTLDPIWGALGCDDDANGRSGYIQHVNTAGSIDESPTGLYSGGEQLSSQIAPLLERYRTEREFLYADRFATRPPLATVLAPATSKDGLKQAAAEAYHRYAYTLQEIGTCVGRSPSTISRWVKPAVAATILPQQP